MINLKGSFWKKNDTPRILSVTVVYYVILYMRSSDIKFPPQSTHTTHNGQNRLTMYIIYKSQSIFMFIMITACF